MSKDSLTITDNRTGRSYEVPVKDGTIKAIDLRQIKVGERPVMGSMNPERSHHASR